MAVLQHPVPAALHEIDSPEADSCQLYAVLGPPGQSEGRVVGGIDHDGDREQGHGDAEQHERRLQEPAQIAGDQQEQERGV